MEQCGNFVTVSNSKLMDPNQARKAKDKSIIDKFSLGAKNFYQFHGVQLMGSDFPVNLIENLYTKLKGSIYDGGNYLEVIDNEQASTYQVKAKINLFASKHIFLIDHALTFRFPALRTVLQENRTILPRLKTMLKYHIQSFQVQEEVKAEIPEKVTELQFDGIGLQEIGHLEFPPSLLTLSLVNNNLTNADQFIKKLAYLSLKALWLNGNPVCGDQSLVAYINNKTKIEIFNSCFTPNCSEWALKYVQSKSVDYANNANSQEIFVLNLDQRNIFSASPEVFKKFLKLRSLSLRGHSFDTEAKRQYLREVLKSLPSLAYLFVDEEAEILFYHMNSKGLFDLGELLVNKHSLSMSCPETGDSEYDLIVEHIPKIAGCYRLANTEQLDESSCWYVNDELGSLVPHSDTPNIKISPFLYAPNNAMDKDVVSFSLLWLLKDVPAGEYICRDYLHGMTEEKQRSSRLAIWRDLSKLPLYSAAIKKLDHKMLDLLKSSSSLLQKFYGTNATKQREAAAKFYASEDNRESHVVATDYEFIRNYLTHPAFKFTDKVEEASVVWLTAAADQEEWKKFKGKCILNQFPFQSCVVMKNHLADTIQSVFGDTPYLMRTYDLEKELTIFLGDYYRRSHEGLDNIWILKPPNMARSMDMLITDNVSLIVKAMETGPKIAQKYISNPVLRQGRKVDLRYILLVRSVNPLTLLLYRHFWIRSSNNPYTVDRRHLATYETQFTVMNYSTVSDFKQIQHQDFEIEFEKDYAPCKWATIHEKIKKMLRNVFIAAAIKHPEMHDDHSRAVYGIDVMVEAGSMEPKLLEITFSPDCKRACQYYPSFYNDVFEALYLNGNPETMERII